MNTATKIHSRRSGWEHWMSMGGIMTMIALTELLLFAAAGGIVNVLGDPQTGAGIMDVGFIFVGTAFVVAFLEYNAANIMRLFNEL